MLNSSVCIYLYVASAGLFCFHSIYLTSVQCKLHTRKMEKFSTSLSKTSIFWKVCYLITFSDILVKSEYISTDFTLLLWSLGSTVYARIIPWIIIIFNFS